MKTSKSRRLALASAAQTRRLRVNRAARVVQARRFASIPLPPPRS